MRESKSKECTGSHRIFTKQEADQYRFKSILIRILYVLTVILLGFMGYFIGEHNKLIALLPLLTAVAMMVFGYHWLPSPTDVRELTGHEYKGMNEMLDYLPGIQRDFAEALNEGKLLRERDWLYVHSQYLACQDNSDRNTAAQAILKTK